MTAHKKPPRDAETSTSDQSDSSKTTPNGIALSSVTDEPTDRNTSVAPTSDDDHTSRDGARDAEVVGYHAIPSAADSDIINAWIPVDAITPHPRNYNVHPDEQIERLRASARRFGQVRSIVVQAGAPGKYMLVAGEGYWTAHKAEGKALIRADIIPANWSALQVEGYLVADNELMRGSEIDELRLAELQEEQRLGGVDLASLGTSLDEHQELMERLATLQLASGGYEDDGSAAHSDDDDENAPDAPEDFKSFDTDLPTEHRCPRCGYTWSGKSS